LDYKSILAANTTTVYFMGGVNAISAANYTALTTALTTAGDTTPPTFKRLAGADRYATANLAATQAGIMVAADKLIVVYGDSWADGISAGVMSAEAGWPIVLQTKTGNNASAKATIDAYLALTSSVKSFVIVGGTGALSTDTEGYLINTKGVAPANIIRLSGADRYATSLNVNNYVRTQGAPFNNIAGINTALVSGETPWDALAATSWAAKNNALVQLTPAAGGNASVASLAATYAAASAASAVAAADYAGQNLFIIGGKTVVPDAAEADSRHRLQIT
jgi:putative cell wall-binding protein